MGRGAPGFHYGRYVCISCPGDDRHVPPYRPFALDTHIRQHLSREPSHVVAYWCYDDMIFEDEWRNLDAPYRSPEKPLVIARRPNRLALRSPVPPTAVLAALETLRRAGYCLDGKAPTPEPEKVYLTASEAEALAIIKRRAGITVPELSERLGVSYSTARNRVRMLSAAGCIRGEIRVWEDGWQVPRRLFAVHDKPIAITEPRQKVPIRRPASSRSGRYGRGSR